jgi:peptidoglycan/LPS O-acetylase OafA/YrhL
LKYRANIDGLRAIAVLSVVLFHLDIPGFAGGYIGVDVFFVISGFLISSIIKHKYETHGFKLADFYFRRIRRLLPPLIATVVATFAGATFILTPFDMISFSRSAVAALFSLSNIVFYLEAGYWDTASELKPLLHTWSLAVEEQFYLFWPALILGSLRIRRHIAFGTSLTLISFAGVLLCIWYTTVDQSAAFYLLPFRIFQFAMGALIIPTAGALASLRFRGIARLNGPVVWLGLGLIGTSVFTLDAATIFPGWAVLLPTIGAALVLLAGDWPGQLPSTARALLENPVSLWLGRLSYSLYLVHWPLIALYRYHNGLELGVMDQAILVVAMLVATIVLHYGVERRFYQRHSGQRPRTAALSGARFATYTLIASALLATVPLTAWQGDGWSWRFPTLTLTPEQIREGQQRRFVKSGPACKVDYSPEHHACDFSADHQVLVIGNSHEPDGLNFISAAYENRKSLNLMLFGNINLCDEVRRVNERFLSSDERCQKRLDALLEPERIASLDLVLYAANKPFAENKEALLWILQYLQSKNPKIKIATLGGYINTNRACTFYINETSTTDACALPENVNYFESDPAAQPLYKAFESVQSHYIDRVSLLCKNRVLQTCRTRTDEGIPMFYDTHHHSLEFAEMTGRLFAREHPDLLRLLLE